MQKLRECLSHKPSLFPGSHQEMSLQVEIRPSQYLLISVTVCPGSYDKHFLYFLYLLELPQGSLLPTSHWLHWKAVSLLWSHLSPNLAYASMRLSWSNTVSHFKHPNDLLRRHRGLVNGALLHLDKAAVLEENCHPKATTHLPDFSVSHHKRETDNHKWFENKAIL